MAKNSKTWQLVVVIGLIFVASLSRLMPHPPNFTAIGAVAIFSGAYFTNARLALLVPLAALFLGDLIIGFYPGMAFVYGAFIVMILLSAGILRKERNLGRVVGTTLTGSTLFFLITNFGVWMSSAMYAKTWAGLIECYTLAIPFFRNQLLGDFFFVGALFAGFAFSEKFSKASAAEA